MSSCPTKRSRNRSPAVSHRRPHSQSTPKTTHPERTPNVSSDRLSSSLRKKLIWRFSFSILCPNPVRRIQISPDALQDGPQSFLFFRMALSWDSDEPLRKVWAHKKPSFRKVCDSFLLVFFLTVYDRKLFHKTPGWFRDRLLCSWWPLVVCINLTASREFAGKAGSVSLFTESL